MSRETGKRTRKELATKEETMCTFENKHCIVVCDIAIQQAREATSRAFGDAVQFTPIEGAGTRVEVKPSIDAEVFEEVTREAIAAAQQKSTT
jgi:hypothetical protein